MSLIEQVSCIPASQYREIPLTQNKIALVDAADYEWLSQHKWFAHCDHSTGRFYAARLFTIGKKKQRYQSMHRQIMGNPPLKVDHRDRDGLHNWRDNLRRANNQQNGANSELQRNNTSGFRGVSFRKDRANREYPPWQSYIINNQKQIHLAFCTSAETAARIRDVAAVVYHGEFATLNFPDEWGTDELGRS